MARVTERIHELHGALTKGRSDVEKKRQSIAIYLCIGIEVDIVDAGLFVHLAQQLHQVLSIKS